jgi:GNAT superfamily N-acetyltransferase
VAGRFRCSRRRVTGPLYRLKTIADTPGIHLKHAVLKNPMVENKQAIQIVPVTVPIVLQAYKLAKSIFPGDAAGVKRSFIATLLPTPLLPVVSNAVIGVRLGFLDYFVGIERTKRVVGITGLYGVEDRKEVWLGWYGVAPSARGQGCGRTLLDWTIKTAKRRGFDTLRLWTSTSDNHARARVMYARRGFVKQELGITDPANPQIRIVLYGLGLRGERPEPFKGDLREALLGTT